MDTPIKFTQTQEVPATVREENFPMQEQMLFPVASRITKTAGECISERLLESIPGINLPVLLP